MKSVMNGISVIPANLLAPPNYDPLDGIPGTFSLAPAPIVDESLITGSSVLKGRTVCVGAGVKKTLADSACETIKGILSDLSNALMVLLHSYFSLAKDFSAYVIQTFKRQQSLNSFESPPPTDKTKNICAFKKENKMILPTRMSWDEFLETSSEIKKKSLTNALERYYEISLSEESLNNAPTIIGLTHFLEESTEEKIKSMNLESFME